MKFVLTKEHRYWWPVTVEMPDPNLPGKWQKMSFTMQFIMLDEDEARRIAKEIADKPAEERSGHEHDVLIAACCNWRDVDDDDKTPVPFSQEALRQAMRQTWFRQGLYNAYTRSLASDQARQGN